MGKSFTLSYVHWYGITRFLELELQTVVGAGN